LLLLLRRWSLGLLGMWLLHRRGRVVLLRVLRMRLLLLLLLVRVRRLRGLGWLCGVSSIVHRLVAPSHVRRLLLLLLLRLLLLRLLLLLLLLRSSVRRLTVPRAMVSE
jgi:hypothetical protein